MLATVLAFNFLNKRFHQSWKYMCINKPTELCRQRRRPLSGPPTSDVFCFESRPVCITRESFFWFRAFADFVVIVAPVGRQVWHDV